ncbi:MULTISPECIES: SWIM zinc finger domain-containing protein [unclassified Ruminococcus]|uniref:SWIM zinc finger family protein n=1 Tax=unclassified Ruminococcus TaxID=2608920 RepID=UPI00210A9A20|nr:MULTISPECIES: hypothetical protein [unclassified Ruminococcus]MCQ4023271.1 hypothetical protein [Ruminococcus sp. zg-924]MCQ4115057.1 hypothetical protein [Ruminococcus sp. zg-921]
MGLKIGFTANINDEEKLSDEIVEQTEFTPRKSVVEVYFPSRDRSYPYFNDSFDLKKGDIVFVDGKLERIRGIVVNVTYNFKIKLSDYKRVIAVADTNVKGELFFAGSHLISFDRQIIPYGKVVRWFKAPENPDDEVVYGDDGEEYELDDFQSMNISGEILSRGHKYYMDNKVVYISLDGKNGKAIVTGSGIYEVEFTYENGMISNLTCDCYCSYHCKHEVAVMFQLRDILHTIFENYENKYKEINYFAAICSSDLFAVAVDMNKSGSVTLK